MLNYNRILYSNPENATSTSDKYGYLGSGRNQLAAPFEGSRISSAGLFFGDEENPALVAGLRGLPLSHLHLTWTERLTPTQTSSCSFQ